MPDIIDEVLKFDPGMQSSRKKREEDRIDEVLKFDPGPGKQGGKVSPTIEGPVGGTYQPTGEISTITTKPIKKYIPGTQPEAGFGTLVKASFVDDPYIKSKIFAESRGISLSRYRVTKEGHVEFKTDEGKWQREVGELGTSKLKSFAADVAGHPSTYLGTAGVTLGVPGAVGGAMAGELVRKGVGKLVYGEKPGTLNTLIDVGLQGVFALAGEGAGKVIGGTVNKFLGKKAGILKRAGEEIRDQLLTPEDHAKAMWVKQLAQQHNIELAPHQLYDREGMTNTWKYLRKHPYTSDAVRKFEDKLSSATDKAMDDFIREMKGYEKTPGALGEELRGTAEKIISKSERARTEAVQPLYEKAFDVAAPVDLTPAIKNLDKVMKSYPEGNVQRTLQGIKKSLTTEGEKIIPAKGNVPEQTIKIKVPESDLRKIQKAIFDLNDLIEGTSYEASKIAPSSKKVLNRELEIVKKDLMGAIERASPEFIQANKLYEKLSPPIEKLKKSVIGELTRMQKESIISKAPGRLLDVSNMPDASLLKVAKREIMKENPDLWKEMVGGYIRDVYEGLKVTQEGKIFNVAGKLQQRLFGSEKQRQLMQAAMEPKEYQAFSDLMTVFQRASIGTGRESMTAPFQAIQEQLGHIPGSKIYRYALFPRQATVETLFGKWNEILVHGRQTDLFNALVSPDAIRKMSSLKQLSPGSKKMIEAFSVFTSLVADKVLIRERP